MLYTTLQENLNENNIIIFLPHGRTIEIYQITVILHLNYYSKIDRNSIKLNLMEICVSKNYFVKLNFIFF